MGGPTPAPTDEHTTVVSCSVGIIVRIALAIAISPVSGRVTLKRVSVSYDTSNDRLTITRYDPAASK